MKQVIEIINKLENTSGTNAPTIDAARSDIKGQNLQTQQAGVSFADNVISLFKALNVSYEIKKENSKEESPYDPEFVKKIVERSENVKRGNVVEYTPELKRQWFGK